MTECPDDERWVELMEGRLRDPERAELEAHLDACERCAELIGLAAGASGPSPTAGGRAVAASIPDRIGRYPIEGVLGRGAMGVVLEGSDPTLQRKVAIKLLQPSGSPGGSWTIAAPDAPVRNVGSSGVGGRVLREARSIARLSHPGIVEIYEVGVGPGGPFIVMELVRGKTLRAWMGQGERRWSEIVGMFVQAARALAAAHDAGVVHRDFKPDNAIVGRDGRLKVLDFGLARAPAMDASTVAMGLSTTSGLTSTEAGAIVGTPVYLAPECLDGQPADARADQYAFFVALFEGLVGHRPFEARSLHALVSAMRAGPDAVLTDLCVPAWLRAAIARGLAPDPEERFFDMRAVVGTLERGLRRGSRRGRFVLAALGSTAIGGVVWAASGEAPCTTASDRVAPAWSRIERARLLVAFEAADAPWAAEVGRRTAGDLDAYARRWVDAHTDVCLSASASEGLGDLDRRMACLVGRLDALDATAELLVQGDRRTLERAPELIAALPPIEACAEMDRVPSDLALVDPRLDEQRALLSKARALVVAGDFSEGERLAASVVDAARKEGSELLQVEALLVRASALIDKGEPEEASASYETAFFLAERLDAAGLALEAAAANALTIAWYLREPTRGLEWLRHAEAAAERIDPTPKEHFAIENRTALVLDAAARHEEALAHHQEALRWLEGTDALPDLARTRMNLGMTLHELGRTREGIDELRAALDLYARAFGEAHPETAAARVNLAAHLPSPEGFDEATRLFTDARDALGDTDDVWPALRLALHVNWGVAASRARQYDEAVLRLEEAIALASRLFGEHHPETFEARLNLGVALEAQGELERALAIYRALRPDLDASPERSPTLGYTIDFNESTVLRKLGRHDEAWTRAHDARRTAERRHSSDDVADAWVEVARVLEGMGRTAEATALRASLAEPAR
jgi:tetratricopeptide (TPR) repeat protein